MKGRLLETVESLRGHLCTGQLPIHRLGTVVCNLRLPQEQPPQICTDAPPPASLSSLTQLWALCPTDTVASAAVLFPLHSREGQTILQAGNRTTVTKSVPWWIAEVPDSWAHGANAGIKEQDRVTTACCTPPPHLSISCWEQLPSGAGLLHATQIYRSCSVPAAMQWCNSLCPCLTLPSLPLSQTPGLSVAVSFTEKRTWVCCQVNGDTGNSVLPSPLSLAPAQLQQRV